MSGAGHEPSLEAQRLSGHLSRSSTDRVVEKAERQARKPDKDAVPESEKPERTLTAVRSPSAERTNGIAGATLPVVEEAGEAGSTSGRSRDESIGNEDGTTKPNGSIMPDGSTVLDGSPVAPESASIEPQISNSTPQPQEVYPNPDQLGQNVGHQLVAPAVDLKYRVRESSPMFRHCKH